MRGGNDGCWWIDPMPDRRSLWVRHPLLMLAAICAAAAVVLSSWAAFAQTGQSNNCSGTVGSSAAAAVSYPASGSTGPSFPTQFVTITNPSATATLWVNPMPGGTAAANAAGSIPLPPLGGTVTWWRPAYPPPAQLSIIASAASTPYTCAYQ